MKLYIAVSENADDNEKSVLQYLFDSLIGQAHEVYGPRRLRETLFKDRRTDVEREYYRWNTESILEADMVIAETSKSSIEVGFIIGFAISQDKPVVCLYRADSWVSRMIAGNKHPGLVVRSYYSEVEALGHVQDVIDALPV